MFIYWIESPASPVRDMFRQISQSGARLVTSEFSIAECLYGAAKHHNQTAVAAYEALFSSGTIELIALDGELTKRAAIAGAELGLQLNDAIHYICALEQGCDFFLTRDKRFQSTPYIEVLHP